MIISVFSVIGSNLAINFDDGLKLFSTINEFPAKGLTIDFSGIKRVSTSFLNESIGSYTQVHPLEINEVHFEIPAGKEIFHDKICNVIENALLGDTFDIMVNNAITSL